MSRSKSESGFIQFLVPILLILGVVVGVYLVQTEQIFKSQASSNNCPNGLCAPRLVVQSCDNKGQITLKWTNQPNVPNYYVWIDQDRDYVALQQPNVHLADRDALGPGDIFVKKGAGGYNESPEITFTHQGQFGHRYEYAVTSLDENNRQGGTTVGTLECTEDKECPSGLCTPRITTSNCEHGNVNIAWEDNYKGPWQVKVSRYTRGSDVSLVAPVTEFVENVNQKRYTYVGDKNLTDRIKVRAVGDNGYVGRQTMELMDKCQQTGTGTNPGTVARITVDPLPIIAGKSFTVRWSGISNPDVNDVIALYDPQGNYLAKFYTSSCAGSLAGTQAQGTGNCTYTAGPDSPSGIYQYRFFPKNDFSMPPAFVASVEVKKEASARDGEACTFQASCNAGSGPESGVWTCTSTYKNNECQRSFAACRNCRPKDQ